LNKLKKSEIEIIKVLRDNPLISRADLSRISGFSKPVVSYAVTDLINIGAIEEVKTGESSRKGGKKPILISFVPDFRYIVGVDVGGNKIISILCDLDGNVINKKKHISKGINKEKELHSIIKESINSVINVAPEKILGIGLGVPGTTDVKKGIIHQLPAFELNNIPLKTMLEDDFNIPVIVSNDVTLNAYGEIWKGAAKDKENVFLIAIGTGTGSGLVLNGNLYPGANNLSGEIGYMITDWSAEKNKSIKSFGNLESWFSGNGFETRVKEELGIELTSIEFFDLIPKDKRIRDIFYEGCNHFCLAVSNILTLLDPGLIVITGGIGFNRYNEIMEVISPILNKIVPPEILEKTEFRKGKLGELGVALGATKLVHDTFFV
jgi:predicted NBD/HSP70 family sugar kinase